jgi:hypothetical protein
MKTILMLGILLLQTIFTFAQIPCSPSLKTYIDKIEQIPEAKKLIASIQKEGAIQIVQSNHSLSNKFGAFWDPDRRVIGVSLSANHTEGQVIGAILFELHNSSVTSQFNRLDHLAETGQIEKDRYVRQMEYIEYLNSHNAAKMAERGIQLGILPRDARLPTYRNFEEHFRAQQIGGHSAWFARNYDLMQNS